MWGSARFLLAPGAPGLPGSQRMEGRWVPGLASLSCQVAVRAGGRAGMRVRAGQVTQGRPALAGSWSRELEPGLEAGTGARRLPLEPAFTARLSTALTFIFMFT